jgi:hypothetical protein
LVSLLALTVKVMGSGAGDDGRSAVSGADVDSDMFKLMSTELVEAEQAIDR